MQQATTRKTRKKNYNPAQWVIHNLGGVRPAAKALKCSASTVCRWDSPKKTAGLRGTVPPLMQQAVLKLAKKKKLDITAEDLILGRKA